jgi:hypothetical protein
MIASKDSIDTDTEVLLSTYHKLDIKSIKSKRNIEGLNKNKIKKIKKTLATLLFFVIR